MKEYSHFPAALAFIGHISPQETVGLLDQRIGFIRKHIASRRSGMDFAKSQGLARIFMMESEYILHQHEAELNWLLAFKEDIKNGSLTEQTEDGTAWHMTVPAGWRTAAVVKKKRGGNNKQ